MYLNPPNSYCCMDQYSLISGQIEYATALTDICVFPRIIAPAEINYRSEHTYRRHNLLTLLCPRLLRFFLAAIRRERDLLQLYPYLALQRSQYCPVHLQLVCMKLLRIELLNEHRNAMQRSSNPPLAPFSVEPFGLLHCCRTDFENCVKISIMLKYLV
jgi:hypothetical protein